MYPYCKPKAFTLFELLITIVILSIIVTIALPSFHNYRERYERAQILPTVRHAVSLARAKAAANKRNTIICPTSNLKSCAEQQWHKGFIIFVDQNNNNTYDLNDLLITVMKTDYSYGSFHWKGGATSKKQILFLSDSGLPSASFGHFLYCSNTDKPHIRIPLSKMGQTRSFQTTSCD